MEADPKTPQYRTDDPTSFAHESARARWPVIITQGIDDVHRTIWGSEHASSDYISEGKNIVAQMAALKYELQHNRELSPIPDDGEPDIQAYNQELEALGTPKWHSVPWLYSECYLYRRISSMFKRTQNWKEYDLFGRQKRSTFRSSRPAVLELTARAKDIFTSLRGEEHLGKSDYEREAAEKILFKEIFEICLWGNATDLSLLTNLSYEDIQKLQGSEARLAAEENIVANDLEKAWEVLKTARRSGQKERRVDIVLDNSGFELFTDCVLASFLIVSGLATKVVLHPKSIPWFVSDVLAHDLDSLEDFMSKASIWNPESEDPKASNIPQVISDAEMGTLQFLHNRWFEGLADVKDSLKPNLFWTAAGSFWRLPTSAPDLHDDLKKSELVIFKGDLNYRKLTADAQWPATTPFTEAIGPLGPGSGIRVLALRTCKADVVVGLPEGVDEKLRAREGGGGDTGARKWAWTGKYAVVQFSDGKA
ncbi:DUF89-domain-containing protein [Sporormia fimetaria CBS 119925]|uniref:Sugar phosphate phosphatase n=1 Tax=Sporormia fimetaria CBS 119925 TaxID=1340428 RepID=A0A6A6VL68_9PLEO|nr:DUF89-domain-containing protein [Sporormia fimetaria CBS 119925]